MIYELWKSGSAPNVELDFFPADGDARRRADLPEKAELIWTVEADSWTEACTLRNRFLGWAHYQPVFPEDSH